MAPLLDILLQSSTRAKSSLQKSAIIRTRRALRSSPSHLAPFMNTLLAQSKTFSSPLVAIPLLGTAADVVTHLKGVGNTNLTIISEEIKVNVVGMHQVLFNGLLDSDHGSIYEFSADGSDASTFTHYDLLHGIRQTFY